MLTVKILGSGCANCVNLEKATRQAVNDLGLDATIEKVTDYAEIAAHGVMKTPALVIDDHVVLSGKVATPAEIADLLQAATPRT